MNCKNAENPVNCGVVEIYLRLLKDGGKVRWVERLDNRYDIFIDMPCLVLETGESVMRLNSIITLTPESNCGCWRKR